jgi:hypothetical protein
VANFVDPVHRDRLVRALLGKTGTGDILSQLANPRHVPSRITALLSPPPSALARAVQFDSPIVAEEISVTVQRYGTDLLLDMSDQDANKLLRAKAEELAGSISEHERQAMLGNIQQYANWTPYDAPPFVPQYTLGVDPAGAQLTLEDLKRAQDALANYGSMDSNGYWHSPAEVDQALLRASGCAERGCAVRHQYSLERLADMFLHNGVLLEIDDAILAKDHDHKRQRFLQWTYVLHEGRLPAIERQSWCALCGRERDPDQEPVEVDLRDLARPNPNYRYAETGTIEACSRECATAFAISLEPVRQRPALGQALEQRHIERDNAAARARVVKAGVSRGVVTDSQPSAGKPTNIWQTTI